MVAVTDSSLAVDATCPTEVKVGGNQNLLFRNLCHIALRFFFEHLIKYSSGFSEEQKELDDDYSWTRYAVLCSTIICLSSLMASIVCFNFTVLCMPATHEHLAVNEVLSFDVWRSCKKQLVRFSLKFGIRGRESCDV
ncbi:hypothetical protein OESDEN_14572 [Oesophagostomum dentatum]|uniref:Uncharacterized protein n=1 Tax=Oesophagostomum dentatum TaxID=61180 RepID=A0A0B1SR93_OESDE|nr:hypothetical protein OESDEN_14572 [Oesophagostomum dentatum]